MGKREREKTKNIIIIIKRERERDLERKRKRERERERGNESSLTQVDYANPFPTHGTHTWGKCGPGATG